MCVKAEEEQIPIWGDENVYQTDDRIESRFRLWLEVKYLILYSLRGWRHVRKVKRRGTEKSSALIHPFSFIYVFPHVLFPILFPSNSTHFKPPVFLFHPCFASLSSTLFSAQSFLNPPSRSSRLQSSPHLLTLVETPEGKWWCNYALRNIRERCKTKQKKKRPCLHCFIIRYICLTRYIEKPGPFCSSVALTLLQLFKTIRHPAANQDDLLHTEAVAKCKWQKSLKYGVVTILKND